MKARCPWLLLLLLVAYAAALAGEAWLVGVTVDEPKELAEAYFYWGGVQGLSPGDSPVLLRMTCGWVPRLLAPPLPGDVPPELSQNSYYLGRRMLGIAGPTGARRLMFATRLTLIVFPILTIWLVWHWARQLFGDGIALILATALALEPTLAAHGALIKSDAAAAFATVWFFYQGWRYWSEPVNARAFFLLAALLVAVLAKPNLLLLTFVAVGIFLCKGPRLAGTALAVGVVYFGVIAAYQFQVRRFEPQELERVHRIRSRWFPAGLVKAVAGSVPWPAELVLYIGRLWKLNSRPQTGYLFGEYIKSVEISYFPLAWGVKFPIGLQVLTFAGIAAMVARVARRRAGAMEAFLSMPLLVILMPALLATLHQGLRHILPLFPFLILYAGFALQAAGARLLPRLVLACCLAGAAVSYARVYPQGIAYFNEWVGGPKNGWHYLADSNLDWGQNLPELARYVAAHDVAHFHLYYFGMDLPEHYIASDRVEVHAGPWPPARVPLNDFQLQPGPGVYAISVNNLLGLGFHPAYRNYFGWFRDRTPDALAGYSILIYHVR